VRVFILQSLQNFSFEKEFIAVLSQMYKRLHAKYSSLLSDFTSSCISSIGFPKNTQTSIFTIPSVWAELFHAGWQKERQAERYNKT